MTMTAIEVDGDEWTTLTGVDLARMLDHLHVPRTAPPQQVMPALELRGYLATPRHIAKIQQKRRRRARQLANF